MNDTIIGHMYQTDTNMALVSHFTLNPPSHLETCRYKLSISSHYFSPKPIP